MKAAINSSAPNYKLRGLVTLFYQYRSVCSTKYSSHVYQNHVYGGTSFSRFGYLNNGSGSSQKRPRLSMLNVDNNESYTTPDDTAMPHSIEDVQPSVVPAPPPRPSSWYVIWGNWLLGSLLPVFVAFWSQKWKKLLKLEGEVEEIAGEVDNVAEIVEKVATTTEKVAAEVAEGLKDGKLKEVVLEVEHVSNVAAKDAQLTKQFVDKLADLKQDIKELETIAEPAIDKIVQVEHEDK